METKTLHLSYAYRTLVIHMVCFDGENQNNVTEVYVYLPVYLRMESAHAMPCHASSPVSRRNVYALCSSVPPAAYIHHMSPIGRRMAHLESPATASVQCV
jgi:hypothetical protein